MTDTFNLAVLGGGDYAVENAELAQRLQLPLTNSVIDTAFSYVLTHSSLGLSLQKTGRRSEGPVLVDFASGSSTYRRNKGGGELIVKAVTGKSHARPRVLDVTAGLGRDSFVLASWGLSVTALERSSVVYSLLADGLKRASTEVDLVAIIERIKLIHIDAMSYLSAPDLERPDVVLIDPMFPPSKKSALVKKEMRAFHHLVGPDNDSGELLNAALDVAIHRVVVKRPKSADFIAGKKPSYCLEGKAIRFDIYAIKAFS